MVAVAAAWYEPMRASPAAARVLVCLEPTAAGEAPHPGLVARSRVYGAANERYFESSLLLS